MIHDRLRVVTRVTPDVFAIVMATGIVSVATETHDYRWIAAVTQWLATIGFVALIAAATAKISTRRQVVAAELADPGSVLGMFTFVAAAAVLSVVWAGCPMVVGVTTTCAVVGWIVFIPASFRLMWRWSGTDLRDRARGGWLLGSVATSALVIVAARAAITHSEPGLIWLATALWVLAIALYVGIAVLILWRAATASSRSEVATPDGWILMGALAIAALAAATIRHAADVLLPGSSLATVAGAVDIGVWVAATLWIPLLLAVHIRQVVGSRVRHGFANPWWSAVFPAGMYATATFTTGTRLDLPALSTVSLVATWIAIGAWAVTAIAMVRTALRWLRPR